MESRNHSRRRSKIGYEKCTTGIDKRLRLEAKFTGTAEIMEAMKWMFRDVIQQVMEVELEAELVRERCQRTEALEGARKNYRNG